MVLEDTRIGGETRHVFTDKPLMFIPDDMRKCVAYVGYRKADGSEHLAGSAFFVGKIMAPDLENLMTGYVVTAKHVIDSIKGKGIDKILLRVNAKSGLQWIETDLKKWKTHPDPAIDVAVLRKSLNDSLDHRQWPTHGFAIPEIVVKERIGIGEDVFFMGLFSEHYGVTKNIPITRIGNIAAMPDEPVPTSLGPMLAYLVEARSIGGLSGSPVFVNVGGGLRGQFVRTLSKFYLLGLMHGHFDAMDAKGDATIVDDGFERTPVNMGIAVVVPAEKILEVIDGFAEEEKEMIETIRKRTYPTMD
jgi:hypothetical protein